MMDWFKEVWLALKQSMKLLFCGKQTPVLLVLGMVMLVAMLVCMDEVKEEKSKIAIGMADEDKTELSQSVIAAMEQLELYEVTTGSEEDLLVLLQQGELSAVCVLKKSFASLVERGKTNKLVTIYETEDGGALLLGDILAGVMMQEICTAKSYQTLLSYGKKGGRETSLTLEEYRNYVAEVLEEAGTEFSFEVTYVSGENEAVKKPAQTIIYEQAIFAVFALMAGLLSVYAVLPFRRFTHGALAGKIKTLPVHGSALYAGSALGAFLVPAFFGVLFLACFAWRNRTEVSQIISLLICTVVYLCVIVCMMLLAAYGIQSRTVYQMGMLAMILVFGICGLVSLVDGLLLPEGTVTWVPNGWYVRRMTELLNQ